MPKADKTKTCWIITEGMAGTQNQCLGVAQALEEHIKLDTRVIQISLNFPWNVLSPYLGFEQPFTFIPKFTAPWPDIVLASGRKAIAAARFIKKASKGNSVTVFIQDPRVNPAQFDLVAVPFHDKTRGSNVIITDGAPNKITPDTINAAKAEFAPLFKPLKQAGKPMAAVLIGGNSKAHRITPALTEKICARLNALDISLMVTASRRTPPECLKIIQNQLDKPHNFIWNGNGENPYFGMLAHADYIFVTSDSTSMLCDAGTTGKPVYLIPLKGGSPKFNLFYKRLKDLGVLRDFGTSFEPWDYAPLNDADKVARAILDIM